MSSKLRQRIVKLATVIKEADHPTWTGNYPLLAELEDEEGLQDILGNED